MTVARHMHASLLIFFILIAILSITAPAHNANTLPEYINLKVPFHYQKTPNYCGEGSLDMIFDYYGPRISQDEIADVAHNGIGTDPQLARRAAHFSNMSRARGDPSLQGYTNRSIGYAAFEHYWSTPSNPDVDEEGAINDLKSILASGSPLMVLTWYDESKKSSHWRVLKGYDDSSGEFILHDPAQPGWGKYYGPDINFDYYDFVNNIWNVNGNRYALFVSPWEINMYFSQQPVLNVTTELHATIHYPCPPPYSGMDYEAQQCAVRLTGEGFIILSNATVQMPSMCGGDWANATWKILPTRTSMVINVSATGIIVGYTTDPKGKNYVYRDRIGSMYSAIMNARPNSPPTVEILSPKGGEVYDDKLDVFWRAEDKDGDAIKIHIDLIMVGDGGKNAPILAKECNNTGHEVILLKKRR